MLKSLLPKENVRYIVSWQQHENAIVPEALKQRKDVEIHRFDIKGLSNNRNNAIDHCRGDIVLIADDDLEFSPDFSQKIIKVYQENPYLDLALFRVDFKNNKSYPEAITKLELPLPRGYFVSSIEITMRRESIRDLRFFPGLGLGAPKMHCGEEELFVTSAIKRGLDCRFYPVEICAHPEDTTGNGNSPEIWRAQGFIIHRIYGASSLLRIPLHAYRHSDGVMNFIKGLKYLSEGVLYSLRKWKSIPELYRW